MIACFFDNFSPNRFRCDYEIINNNKIIINVYSESNKLIPNEINSIVIFDNIKNTNILVKNINNIESNNNTNICKITASYFIQIDNYEEFNKLLKKEYEEN